MSSRCLKIGPARLEDILLGKVMNTLLFPFLISFRLSQQIFLRMTLALIRGPCLDLCRNLLPFPLSKAIHGKQKEPMFLGCPRAFKA